MALPALLAAAIASTACSRPAPPTEPPLLNRAPPTANRATYREMWADAHAARSPGDGGGGVRVPADAHDPDDVPVGAPVTLTAELEVGAHGIAVGGAISVIPSPFWGWPPPYVGPDAGPGRTTLRAPDGVTLDPEAVGSGEGGMLIATVGGRALQPGERIRVVYDARADRFTDRAGPALWFAVDADGDGVRAVVRDPGPLRVSTHAGPAAGLVATWPSAASPGAEVTVHLAVVDAVGNAFGADGPREVALRAGAGVDVPPTVTLGPDGTGFARAVVHEAGVFALSVRALDADGGALDAVTNPMVVRDGAAPILWGDLHVHTSLSDGTGDPADVLRYARDVAGLDVVALTDHDHWGMTFLDADPAARQALADATDAAYAPGAFVTAHGFEWTSWVWGHRTVVAFDGPVWLSSLGADPEPDGCDTVGELHAALRGRDAIVVRHHPAGGPVAVDWDEPMDPVLEPVVEVASVHGQSESQSLPGAIYDAVPSAFIDQVWARGARFGLIGSTDSHDGHPGLSQLAGGGGGLVALVGAEATRASALEALRARRVYATNGPRIVLRFEVDGAPMGSTIGAAGPVSAVVRVVGTAPIDRIELVRAAGVVGSRRGDGSALLHAAFDVDPSPGDLVYVRVVQRDGGIAWSSPVFFADPRP